MTHFNPTLTPYNTLTVLDQQQSTQPLTTTNATKFRQTLGEIRYITESARPDIAYETNCLAQQIAHPQQHHYQASKALLRYLKVTRTHGLLYSERDKADGTPTPLTVFSDADFANEKNRKYITGTLHCVFSTPDSWTSRKQNIVALSTTQAEYVAATDATRPTNWLTQILTDAHSPPTSPIPHNVDNRSAMLIALNQAPTKQRKYIDVRHHYLQHHVNRQTIRILRIPTADMTADIFTKPLHRDRFILLRMALNITLRPTQK